MFSLVFSFSLVQIEIDKKFKISGKENLSTERHILYKKYSTVGFKAERLGRPLSYHYRLLS